MLRNQSGLTLLEMLIAIVLMSVVLFTFYALIGVAVRGWGALEGQTEVQQQPRVAVGRIAGEIRQARDFVIGPGGAQLGLVKVTVLTQDTAAGLSTLTVEDASALVVGRPLVILAIDRLERRTVSAIAGTTVSLSAALTRTHRRGEVVRRAQTALNGPALAGFALFLVSDGTVVQAGDLVAIGDEGPLTVTGVVGNLVSISPGLAASHPDGEVVQPLTVMFQCESGCPASGGQLTRCTQGCTAAASRIPLADLLSAPAGRVLFSATASPLSAPAAQGATQVCPAAVTGFAVDDRVQIGRESQRTGTAVLPDRRVVTAVNAGCLVLDRGLARGYPAGTPVRVNGVELNARAVLANDVIGGQTQQVLVTTKAVLRN